MSRNVRAAQSTEPSRSGRWSRVVGLALLVAGVGACGTTGGEVGGSTVEYVALPKRTVVTATRPRVEPRRVATVEAAPEEHEAREEPEPPRVAEGDVLGVRHLDNVHPALRSRALELYRRLRAEGIAVRFIFGATPYAKRTKKGLGGWATWHMFGLAVDLNLVHRKGLGDAKKHFAEDHASWVRIGELCAELGLVWGGIWRSYDPFHLEWHPGDDATINKQDLARFLALAGPNGKDYRAVWRLYPDPNGRE